MIDLQLCKYFFYDKQIYKGEFVNSLKLQELTHGSTVYTIT